MNQDLIKAIDTIYWPLGGYKGVSSEISESEMADAVIFGGPTWYTSSLYTATGPYYLFDLATIGYNPGQLYRVFNNKFEFQYSARAERQPESNEINWGYLPEERQLVRDAPHASRWFFLFNSPTGPQLSQFIVDRSADPDITQAYLKDVIRKNAIVQAYSALNEAFISYKGVYNLYTVVAGSEAIKHSSDIIKHADGIALTGLLNTSYFQPKHDTWIVATDAQDNPLRFFDVSGIDNWEKYRRIDSDGYELLFIEARPRSTNSPINRMIGGLGTPIVANFTSKKLNVSIQLSDMPEPED